MLKLGLFLQMTNKVAMSLFFLKGKFNFRKFLKLHSVSQKDVQYRGMYKITVQSQKCTIFVVSTNYCTAILLLKPLAFKNTTTGHFT